MVRMQFAVRGVTNRADQICGVLAGELLADPEVVRRAPLETSKRILDEGEPPVACGVLGKARRDEWSEAPHPEQSHETERKLDVLIIGAVVSETGCAVGNSYQGSQKRELVGR